VGGGEVGVSATLDTTNHNCNCNAQGNGLLLQVLRGTKEQRFERGASTILHCREELLVCLGRQQRARGAECFVDEDVHEVPSALGHPV